MSEVIIFMKNLSSSDVIQVVSIITSFLLSFIAIIISCLTLKQNSKMIEDSTRPVICIYSRRVILETQAYYLVIKNYGSSYATIKKLDTSFDFSGCCAIPTQKNYIADLVNCSIAPNQAKICLLDYDKIPDTSVTFNIEYCSGSKSYSDSIPVDLKAGIALPEQRAGGDPNPERDIHNISFTLQEMLLKDI